MNRIIIGDKPSKQEKFLPISRKEFLRIFTSKCLRGIDGKAPATTLLYQHVTKDYELYCQF